MNNATETQTTRSVVAPGLLEQAQERSGIRSESAFARLIGVDVAEASRLRAGGELTIRGLVGISDAFGTPLSAIVASGRAEQVAA